MKLVYLMTGIILVPFGIVVVYVDRYLARKQEELRRQGMSDVNLYWPVSGPRPWMGPILIAAGLTFLLIYHFQMKHFRIV